ncbi:MAG: hypothetical protein ABIE55_00775 [Candidatus Aenigmatarchaeota archaeon]
MNQNDKRLLPDIKKALKRMDREIIYNNDSLRKEFEKQGLPVSNMGSVSEALLKRHYLTRYGTSNYMIHERL